MTASASEDNVQEFNKRSGSDLGIQKALWQSSVSKVNRQRVRAVAEREMYYADEMPGNEGGREVTQHRMADEKKQGSRVILKHLKETSLCFLGVYNH